MFCLVFRMFYIEEGKDRKRVKELLCLLKKLKWDENTGYITKNYFENVLYPKIEKEINEKGGTVLFFDADNLKRINDFYGYHVGDAYLKGITYYVLKKVKEKVGKGVIYPIRIGGDEFLLIVPEKHIKVDLNGKNFTYSIVYLKPDQIKEDYLSLKKLIKHIGRTNLYKKSKK